MATINLADWLAENKAGSSSSVRKEMYALMQESRALKDPRCKRADEIIITIDEMLDAIKEDPNGVLTAESWDAYKASKQRDSYVDLGYRKAA